MTTPQHFNFTVGSEWLLSDGRKCTCTAVYQSTKPTFRIEGRTENIQFDLTGERVPWGLHEQCPLDVTIERQHFPEGLEIGATYEVCVEGVRRAYVAEAAGHFEGQPTVRLGVLWYYQDGRLSLGGIPRYVVQKVKDAPAAAPAPPAYFEEGAKYVVKFQGKDTIVTATRLQDPYFTSHPWSLHGGGVNFCFNDVGEHVYRDFPRPEKYVEPPVYFEEGAKYVVECSGIKYVCTATRNNPETQLYPEHPWLLFDLNLGGSFFFSDAGEHCSRLPACPPKYVEPAPAAPPAPKGPRLEVGKTYVVQVDRDGKITSEEGKCEKRFAVDGFSICGWHFNADGVRPYNGPGLYVTCYEKPAASPPSPEVPAATRALQSKCDKQTAEIARLHTRVADLQKRAEANEVRTWATDHRTVTLQRQLETAQRAVSKAVEDGANRVREMRAHTDLLERKLNSAELALRSVLEYRNDPCGVDREVRNHGLRVKTFEGGR